MARKRAAIVTAARETFLRVGYEGASMENIAVAAGVSIATLYRHATKKDDLFVAVILDACDHATAPDEAGDEALLRRPLRDLLVEVGAAFQDKVTQDETVALFRTVMVECGRFPKLGQAAYDGLVVTWRTTFDGILARRDEFHAVAPRKRLAMVGELFDALIGTDILRVLLGGHRPTAAERGERAGAAADEFLATLTEMG